MSDEPLNNMRDKIKGWLLAAEWSVEELPSPDHVLWGLQGSPGTVPVAFYQVKREVDCLIIQTDSPMTPNQRAKYDKARRGREEIIRDLHRFLFKHHVEFRWDDESYKAVVIVRIYLDGLTKDRFWRLLTKLRMVAFDALAFFDEKLGPDRSASPAIN